MHPNTTNEMKASGRFAGKLWPRNRAWKLAEQGCNLRSDLFMQMNWLVQFVEAAGTKDEKWIYLRTPWAYIKMEIITHTHTTKKKLISKHDKEVSWMWSNTVKRQHHNLKGTRGKKGMTKCICSGSNAWFWTGCGNLRTSI